MSKKMTEEELLGEVEDILRTKPSWDKLGLSDENLEWLGRTAAFVERWNSSMPIHLNSMIAEARSPSASDQRAGISKILILLNQARHDLRMKTIGPVNLAMGKGRVFDYLTRSEK